MMKSSSLVVTLAGVLCTGLTVWAQQTTPNSGKSAEAVKDARRDAFLFRAGQFDVAAGSVARLEGALQTDPDNVALLNALVTAYQHQSFAAGQPGGDTREAFRLGLRAFALSERALKIDPNNPDALASHGGMLAAAAQRPERVQQGIAEVYRSIELAPSAVAPRLYRAAIGLTQPADRRDTAALIEDLTFLSKAGSGSRSGDMEHILLADLYAEIGKADEARREYVAATRRPTSAVKDLVQSRLAALEQGTVPAGEITKLRGRILGECQMCHAR